MPYYCLVINCKSYPIKHFGLKFFRVPSIYTQGGFGGKKICELSRKRREKWSRALKRIDLTEKKLANGRICSRHFHSGAPAALQDINNPDWIPSMHMGYSTSSTVNSEKQRIDRYLRAKIRNEQVLNVPISKPELSEPMERRELENLPAITPTTYEELRVALQQANAQIRELQDENSKLKDELKRYKFEEEHFIENNEDVAYFTGLPEFVYLKNVQIIVQPYLIPHSKLSNFHQLLLTLMRLRLNFHFTYLSKIFQVHRTTVSRVFERVIEILYYRLKTFIEWPRSEDLQTNVPTGFRRVFGLKVTVIIDCFEVFIERPPNLEARAKTWSNYKHHNTIKFLIGISSQGCIIYISRAYGGRASDKFLTEDSGFLENLLPGDLVIADRGFAIDDSVRLYCAEVKYPAFLKGKKQLSSIEAEETRQLAAVRVHVERVIGNLKGKFTIFTGIFPMRQLQKMDDKDAFVDKLVTVCASLLNICPSIISLDSFF